MIVTIKIFLCTVSSYFSVMIATADYWALLYFVVACVALADISNGVMTCSLGDDGVPSSEDICKFTCNTGYELTGSTSTTCQSDGRWSGTETICKRSEFSIQNLK